MRVRGLPGLPLVAIFTLASLGVLAQESNSSRGPARGVRAPESAATKSGGVTPAIGRGAALADAVKRGDQQAVQVLLKKNADVNAPQSDGTTALHWAAYGNDAETTAKLIRAGANVNARNNYGVTPLAIAA